MSILSTNTKLIKVGQDYSAGSGISIDDKVISVTGSFGKTYSAGDNIDIYNQGEQLYISSKDWSEDIANASANAYNEAVSQIPSPFDPSYISGQVDNKLDTTAFTAWQNGQYSTDLQTIEGQINNKLDDSAFADVSGTFLTAHQSLDGYATVEDVKSATSGKADTSGVVDYFDKPEIGDPGSVWASGGKLHAGYTAEAAYLYAYGNSQNFTEFSPTQIFTISENKKTIDITKLSATTTGFTAAGIEIGQNKVEISGGSYYGVQIRTPNTAMASAGLYYSNENVPRYAPLFSAKNSSGDGFAIWAGGAKGFDASGNTIWDATAPAKLIGWSNYQGTALDPRAVGINGSIIATVYPDDVPTSMAISSAPYSYMNGDGIYACGQGGTKLSVDSQQRSITVVVPRLSSTAQMNHVDVSYTKYNTDISANEIWSLTGSVQKREIEYDEETSAITAIAGSAIGGGVTGGGNQEIESYVQNNSATIDETVTTYQSNSGSYQPSGNYIPYTAVDPVFNSFETNRGLEVTTSNAGSLRSTSLRENFIKVSYIDSTIGINNHSTLTTYNLTFSTSSDSAYLDKEKIHTWDSASNYVQNISSTWNEVSTTVQSNLAQWAEGGGAISSYTSSWCSDIPPYGNEVIEKLNDKYLKAFISNSADNANFANNANSAKSANYALAVNETYVENKGFTRNLSSEYGTISVIHNNIIESTNSAISRTGNEGFVSAFEGASLGPGGTATYSWDKSLPNTIINLDMSWSNGEVLTYSANTDLTGEIVLPTGVNTQTINIPNATEFKVWSNIWIGLNSATVSAADQFETTVGELAWASALPTYEYDNTNKISAINGSAICGGGGVTGEFVPQSAFDELKQSYDALSSLFATYSGQWLLPNEGV